MSKYTVTIQLADRDSFVHFVDNVGPVVGQLVVTVEADVEADEAVLDEGVRAMESAEERRKVRQPRGSKVNDTILAALHNSTLTVRQLKEALEQADLSPGSLSTGIAMLQKSGQIERVGEGLYALAGYKQAAE